MNEPETAEQVWQGERGQQATPASTQTWVPPCGRSRRRAGQGMHVHAADEAVGSADASADLREVPEMCVSCLSIRVLGSRSTRRRIRRILTSCVSCTRCACTVNYGTDCDAMHAWDARGESRECEPTPASRRTDHQIRGTSDWESFTRRV